jgi:hypothetical protein
MEVIKLVTVTAKKMLAEAYEGATGRGSQVFQWAHLPEVQDEP